MYQLGWFSTGRDKAARDLLTAINSSIKQGEIAADIAFVAAVDEQLDNGPVFQKRNPRFVLGYIYNQLPEHLVYLPQVAPGTPCN